MEAYVKFAASAVVVVERVKTSDVKSPLPSWFNPDISELMLLASSLYKIYPLLILYFSRFILNSEGEASVIVVSSSAFAISQLALPSLFTKACILGDSRKTPYTFISLPLIALTRLTEASNDLAAISVSFANSFVPITVNSSSAIDIFGKCRNSERFTSLKSTLASMFLLISFFTRPVICFLNKTGTRNAAAIRTSIKMAMPLAILFSVFFIGIGFINDR